MAPNAPRLRLIRVDALLNCPECATRMGSSDPSDPPRRATRDSVWNRAKRMVTNVAVIKLP